MFDPKPESMEDLIAVERGKKPMSPEQATECSGDIDLVGEAKDGDFGKLTGAELRSILPPLLADTLNYLGKVKDVDIDKLTVAELRSISLPFWVVILSYLGKDVEIGKLTGAELCLILPRELAADLSYLEMDMDKLTLSELHSTSPLLWTAILKYLGKVKDMDISKLTVAELLPIWPPLSTVILNYFAEDGKDVDILTLTVSDILILTVAELPSISPPLWAAIISCVGDNLLSPIRKYGENSSFPPFPFLPKYLSPFRVFPALSEYPSPGMHGPPVAKPDSSEIRGGFSIFANDDPVQGVHVPFSQKIANSVKAVLPKFGITKYPDGIVDIETGNSGNVVRLPPWVMAETAVKSPHIQSHGLGAAYVTGLSNGVPGILFPSRDSDEIYTLPVTVLTSKTGNGNASSSKLAEIVAVTAASGIFTLIGNMNLKASYSTETKILGGVLAAGFAGAMISMSIPKRDSLIYLMNEDDKGGNGRVSCRKLPDLLVKLGAVCVYSAVMGSMAMLLDVNKAWMWGITGVCSLFPLIALSNVV